MESHAIDEVMTLALQQLLTPFIKMVLVVVEAKNQHLGVLLAQGGAEVAADKVFLIGRGVSTSFPRGLYICIYIYIYIHSV